MKKSKGKKRAPLVSRSGMEERVIILSLTFAFIVLLSLVIVFSRVIQNTVKLTLENSIEKSFNNILFDLQMGDSSSSTILADHHVLGVAIYDSSGSLAASWGSGYSMMPISGLVSELADSDGQGVMRFNKENNQMEYMRYIRLPSIVASYKRLPSTASFDAMSNIDFSSIMYIAFDGSNYHKRLTFTYLCTILAIAGICLLYWYVIRIYLENRDYKEQMVKQENLVNLGQAARTLTHEIKNPLSAITLQIALLKRQLSGEYLDELKLVEHEVQRLIQLTNRVSDFLRNPGGQPEQIDMAALINSLIPLFAYKINVLPNSKTQAYVLFDPERLRSVLENILKNAIESCEGRDPQVEVEITLGRNNVYHVFIRDRGDGIDKVETEKLFDPFFTTKIHGSGIGLSICRQFLKARGGDIRLSKRDGGGTVVEITISKYSLVEELVAKGPKIKKKVGKK